MSKITASPNRGQASTQTIAAAATAMQTVLDRSEGMPGIAALSGKPGLGKTSAAIYLGHPSTFNSVYVSCRSFETTKSLAQLLLKELGIATKANWSISTAFELICEALVQNDRPLVVDEVDHISEKNSINFLRDLHDTVHLPLFLIGEERLKQKLATHHARFHDRVLVWADAMPANASDLGKLLKHYAPSLVLDDESKRLLLTSSGGLARKIVTAINALQQRAGVLGADALSLADVQETLKGVR